MIYWNQITVLYINKTAICARCTKFALGQHRRHPSVAGVTHFLSLPLFFALWHGVWTLTTSHWLDDSPILWSFDQTWSEWTFLWSFFSTDFIDGPRLLFFSLSHYVSCLFWLFLFFILFYQLMDHQLWHLYVWHCELIRWRGIGFAAWRINSWKRSVFLKCRVESVSMCLSVYRFYRVFVLKFVYPFVLEQKQFAHISMIYTIYLNEWLLTNEPIHYAL